MVPTGSGSIGWKRKRVGSGGRYLPGQWSKNCIGEGRIHTDEYAASPGLSCTSSSGERDAHLHLDNVPTSDRLCLFSRGHLTFRLASGVDLLDLGKISALSAQGKPKLHYLIHRDSDTENEDPHLCLEPAKVFKKTIPFQKA